MNKVDFENGRRMDVRSFRAAITNTSWTQILPADANRVWFEVTCPVGTGGVNPSSNAGLSTEGTDAGNLICVLGNNHYQPTRFEIGTHGSIVTSAIYAKHAVGATQVGVSSGRITGSVT